MASEAQQGTGRRGRWGPIRVLCGGRTEGDAAHLLEGTAVVAFDRETGRTESDLAPMGSGLRWQEFIDTMADVYQSRFADI